MLSNYNKVKEIIQKISFNTRYQKWLIVYFLIYAFAVHFAGCSTKYLFNNPVFQCSYSTQLVEEKQACEHLDVCQVKNYGSLTAYLHLVCGENKVIRNRIRMMKGIGQWVGIIMIGIFSDKFGKKRSLLFGLIAYNLWFISIFIGSYLNNHILVGISQLADGIGLMVFQQVTYIHITRFLEKQSYEQLTVLLFLAGSGFSLMVFGMITLFITSWEILVLIASIPLFGLLIMSFILKEDPFYLMQMGKVQQCKEVIRYIAKVNQTNQLLVEEQIEVLCQIPFHSQDNSQSLFTCQSITNNIQLWKLVIICGIVYFVNHISESSFHFTAQQIGYSYQGNLLILGLASLLSGLSFLCILQYQDQRKRGYSYTTIIEFLLSALYLTSFIQSSKLLQIFLLFLLKFLKIWTMNFFTRFEVDCLPKSYQTTLMGIVLLIGTPSIIFQPLIIQFQSDNRICAIVMNNALKLIFGVGLLLFIKEKYYQVNEGAKSQQFFGDSVRARRISMN